MELNTRNQTLTDLLDVLNEKSSVFCYKEDVKAPYILSKLAEEMKSYTSLPVIRICWNENEQKNITFIDELISFHLFKNFTSAMIQIEKLLSNGRYLILLEDLSKLKQLKNNRSYMHFLSVLLNKSEKYRSTIMTTVDQEDVNLPIISYFVSQFSNRFIIEDTIIKKTEDDLPDIKYKICGETLHLEPNLQTDMNKIKDIFSLTPEEKKELDRIVGQRLEEYKTSL